MPCKPCTARLALVIAAAWCLSCGGCKTSSSTSGADAGAPVAREWLEGTPAVDSQTPQRGGALTVRVMAEPASLNYLEGAVRDAWVSRLTRNLVFECLLEIDSSTFELKPQLAERFEESADHRVTTFHLRQGVKFHSGAEFSARDVIAVFDAVKDAKRNTGNVRADFVALQAWRAVDAQTVELTWREPSPFALRQVAKLPMYSATSLQGDWAALAAKPDGTGPFRVAEWQRGHSLQLFATGAWWGGAVPLERVVFRFVKDHTAAASLLEKGEFDVMTTVQPALWKAMENPADTSFSWARTGYQRLRGVDNSYSYVGWNEAVPALADVRVRRALALTYPSEVMASSVDLGLELPTTCPYWLRSNKCDSSVKAPPSSVGDARAALLDAGFADSDGDGVVDRNGAPLTLRFLMPSTSVRLGKLGPLWQEQLKRVGVELTLDKVETTVMSSRVAARDFEVVSRVWTEFDAEQDQYPTFHSSQIDGGSNFVGYASAEADRLMEQLRVEWDPAKRLELEHALHRRLYEDQPYLFMTVRQSLDLAKRRVHGLTPSPLWYDLRRVWVEP